jgi:PAS domain S-box-containing protein
MTLFAVGLATVARLALMPVLGYQFPFLTFFLALVFAAWFGGLGPSMIALAISLVPVPYFLDPPGSLVIEGVHARLGLGLYVGTGLAICLMGGSMRQAQLRAEASEAVARQGRARLEEEVVERRHAEDEKDRLLREQQRLRAAAEEQSALLANLLEQAPVGITFFDSDLRVSRINSYNAALLGDEPDRLIGRPLRDIAAAAHPPDVAERVERTFREVLETGEPYSVRGWASELADRAGVPIFSDWSLRRIDGPDGRAAGLLLIAQEVTEQKRLEAQRNRLLEELEAKQTFTEDIIRQVPAGIIVADASTGTMLLSNTEAQRMVHAEFEPGHPLPEYDDRVDLAGFHPDGTRYRPDEWPLARALRMGEVVKEEEIELRLCDGTRRSISVNAGPIRDAWGRIVAAVTAFHDVTDRKRADRAIRESEARFRHLADAIPQIVWISGPEESSLLYLNRRWFEYTGVPEDRSLRDPEIWEQAVHPDDLDRVVESAADSVKNGGPFEAEYRLRDGTGTYRWFLGRAVPVVDDAGRVVCRFGTATDIEDRKRSEQAARFLADASSALASLVDESSTLQQLARLAVPHFADWCVVDMAGGEGTPRRLTVAHVDPAKVALAHELHRRYPPDPEAPTGVHRILRSGEPERIAEITDEMLVAGARDDEHLRIVRELGLRSYMGVPLPGRAGTIGVISFVSAESGRRYGPEDLRLAQDLACRAAIAIENARLYEELKDADRQKDEFLATLAHELRNPLAPIRNALRLMSDPAAGDHESDRAMAERQVAHLARLVDDLIDVARITQGKIELRREAVALASLVTGVVATVDPAVRERGQSLEVSLPDGPVWLEADPTRLEQVRWNLLDNAIKYTNPGGRISLRVEARGGEVALRVEDTGIGISPEALPRVFEMFYQGPSRSDRMKEGLGIGLGLIRKLVELHGGRIEARSEGPGRGSQFVVTLPLATADEAASPHAGPAPPAGRSHGARATRQRILVVDDHIDAATSLARLLSIMGGHEVEVAHDGLTALRLARCFRPELAILDIGMPVMDGYELARRLRDLEGLGPLKLVALSGWGQDGDRQKARDAGFESHLVKPVDPSALLELLFEDGRGTPGA